MALGFPYRLALDLGTTSIGWAVFKLGSTLGEKGFTPSAIVRSGVRIFSDGRHPKTAKTNLEYLL